MVKLLLLVGCGGGSCSEPRCGVVGSLPVGEHHRSLACTYILPINRRDHIIGELNASYIQELIGLSNA